MLNCKSESLANGEKQSERSRCVEMVADCSKRPDHAQTANARRPSSVRVRRVTAAQVDAESRDRRCGSDEVHGRAGA